jgi:uncharacterized protein
VSLNPWIEESDYYRDRDLPLYHEEFAAFLPERLLDVHCHVYLLEHQVRQPTAEERGRSFGCTERDFAVEDLRECHEALFPGKRVESLLFGMPSPIVDLARNNAYVAEHIAAGEASGLALLDPRASAAELRETVTAGGFVGLKPYHELVLEPAGPEVTIPEMVPAAARQVADELGLVILLHVPRAGRIADPANIREVVDLCTECPNARVILAHVGRSYGPWFIEQAIGALRELPNLSYDIAALDDAETIGVVLDNVPHERLLFGTDLPIAAHRGKHLCVNRQCIFLTRTKHPWSVSSDEPGALKLTFFAYETVRALKRACEQRGLTRAQVEDICYGNARALLDAARRSIG